MHLSELSFKQTGPGRLFLNAPHVVAFGVECDYHSEILFSDFVEFASKYVSVPFTTRNENAVIITGAPAVKPGNYAFAYLTRSSFDAERLSDLVKRELRALARNSGIWWVSQRKEATAAHLVTGSDAYLSGERCAFVADWKFVSTNIPSVGIEWHFPHEVVLFPFRGTPIHDTPVSPRPDLSILWS